MNYLAHLIWCIFVHNLAQRERQSLAKQIDSVDSKVETGNQFICKLLRRALRGEICAKVDKLRCEAMRHTALRHAVPRHFPRFAFTSHTLNRRLLDVQSVHSHEQSRFCEETFPRSSERPLYTSADSDEVSTKPLLLLETLENTRKISNF